MPTVIDHIFAVLLVVGIPLYAVRYSWPRMRRHDIAEADPATRIRIYWGIMGPEWLLAVMAIASWQYGDRSWGDFGFALRSGWRLWTGLGAAAVVTLAMTVQYLIVTRSAGGRGKALAEIRRVAPFAPQTRPEMTHFTLLAVTAGVCEEILYRGFLIWYAVRFTGAGIGGLALAVVGSALVFAIAHLYQGLAGALRVVGIGLVFGGVYVLCESLWVVIALHVYMDIAGGLLSLSVHRALRRDQSP